MVGTWGEDKLFSNNFLNIFPVISALMVMGIHSYGVKIQDGITAASFIEGFFSHGLFCAAVPGFFILSGNLFFKSIYLQNRTVAEIGHKLKKRVLSLIVPFLAWSGFYWAFYAIGNHCFGIKMQHAPSLTIADILSGIILYEYSFPLWFLFQLIFYTFGLTFIVFYITKFFKNKSYLLFLLLAYWFTPELIRSNSVKE